MSDELLFIFKNKTDIHIEKAKKTPETVEVKMISSRQTFVFDNPLNLEEDKRLLGLTNSENYNSVYNTPEKKQFFILQILDWTDPVTMRKIKNVIKL